LQSAAAPEEEAGGGDKRRRLARTRGGAWEEESDGSVLWQYREGGPWDVAVVKTSFVM